jgi:hypothetical protein
VDDFFICETADYLSYCMSGACGESTKRLRRPNTTDLAIVPAVQAAARLLQTAAALALQMRRHAHGVVA